VAVLIDPHLIDYDLTVLVPAGVFMALALPRTRVALVAMYIITLTRPHIQVGDGAILVIPIVLAACLVFALSALHSMSVGGATRVGEYQQRRSVVST
jgi:hypothetical protein